MGSPARLFTAWGCRWLLGHSSKCSPRSSHTLCRAAYEVQTAGTHHLLGTRQGWPLWVTGSVLTQGPWMAGGHSRAAGCQLGCPLLGTCTCLTPAHQTIVVPKAAASGLSTHVRSTSLLGYWLAQLPPHHGQPSGGPVAQGHPLPRTPWCCSHWAELPAAAAQPVAWASSQESWGASGQSQTI